MKILRYLVVAVLFFGVHNVAAHAFATTILDPVDIPGFAVVDPGVPFDITYVPCFFNLSEGCFLGFNESWTQTLTTLDITFPATPALGTDEPTCNIVGSLFGAADCQLIGDQFILDFAGGTGIAPRTLFFVIEDGVCPSDFPTGSAVGDPTPEPGSIWLALSFILPLAYIVRRRRRGLVV